MARFCKVLHLGVLSRINTVHVFYFFVLSECFIIIQNKGCNVTDSDPPPT